MTYKELSEVRQTLRVDWYRCQDAPGFAARIITAQRCPGLVSGRRAFGAIHLHRFARLLFLVAGALAGDAARAVLSRHGDLVLPRRGAA